MRTLIGIMTVIVLTSAAIFAASPVVANAAATKHKSHKAPKTEYMRAVPSTPPSGR